MKLVQQRLDYTTKWQLPDVYIFTGNKYITKQGKLVMGRGAALQCKNTWKHCDALLANKIEKKLPGNFYLVFCEVDIDQFLGAFQVKHHYADKACIKLIKRSAEYLATAANARPHITFHMNFPGVGYGKLSYDTIIPIVETLPDNVILYK